jgi:hypothetical protein
MLSQGQFDEFSRGVPSKYLPDLRLVIYRKQDYKSSRFEQTVGLAGRVGYIRKATIQITTLRFQSNKTFEIAVRV